MCVDACIFAWRRQRTCVVYRQFGSEPCVELPRRIYPACALPSVRFAPVTPWRNLSPRNVFETLAEETGSRHWMCRIVSASSVATPRGSLERFATDGFERTQVNLFSSPGI